MSFDEFALICTDLVINVLSQVKSGLSFFFQFPDVVFSGSTHCHSLHFGFEIKQVHHLHRCAVIFKAGHYLKTLSWTWQRQGNTLQKTVLMVSDRLSHILTTSL